MDLLSNQAIATMLTPGQGNKDRKRFPKQTFEVISRQLKLNLLHFPTITTADSRTPNMKEGLQALTKMQLPVFLRTAPVSKVGTLPTACSYTKDAFHKIKKQNQACAGRD